MIKDLYQVLAPAQKDFHVEFTHVLDCARLLAENQKYYQKTRGSHAAMLFDDRLQIISFAEDVGRHNALDKAVGKALMNGKLPAP